ncbi:Neuronal acetylcholine receptor subunit [Mactra antiquata]
MFRRMTLPIFVILWSILSCPILAQPPPPGPKPYSKELETELRDYLFNGYQVMQRPQKKVTVRTALNLLSLNYLVWMDSRMYWMDNSTYNNIRFLFSTELSLWRPALIVENSVNNIDVISKPSIPFRIQSNGKVEWLPAGIFTTHCESYITYWPLDTQKCDIILSSWGYTGNEVELVFDEKGNGIVMTFYQEHGEWELLNKSHSSVVTEREDESFSRLIFSFTFRRRPLFHMLNTLFPVVLMSFLTVAIFKLSPESGERVGLALTILLAYAVYLTLISESIPQTSMSASLLSSYLASTLFLQTLAVLLTVIYLDIYFTPEEKPVARWLQVFAQCCLARITCVDCCKRRKKDVQPTGDSVEELYDYNMAKAPPGIESDKNGESQRKSEAWVDDVSDDVETGYSWKEIALMLDKITMYIYLVLVTCLTFAVTGIMLNQYLTAYAATGSDESIMASPSS